MLLSFFWRRAQNNFFKLGNFIFKLEALWKFLQNYDYNNFKMQKAPLIRRSKGGKLWKYFWTLLLTVKYLDYQHFRRGFAGNILVKMLFSSTIRISINFMVSRMHEISSWTAINAPRYDSENSLGVALFACVVITTWPWSGKISKIFFYFIEYLGSSIAIFIFHRSKLVDVENFIRNVFTNFCRRSVNA